MVSTKHCCWGECKTDLRYREKCPKSLKEVEKSGRKVFIPFPKPSQDIEKCRRWIVACLRQFFTENNITRNTYVCALHWPGEKGPTEEFPDPLKENFSPAQASRASVKRKSPASRTKPVTRVKREKKIVDGQDAGEELSDFNLVNDELEESATYLPVNKRSVTGKMVLDEGTQIVFTKYMLSAKVETMVLNNEVSTMKE